MKAPAGEKDEGKRLLADELEDLGTASKEASKSSDGHPGQAMID